MLEIANLVTGYSRDPVLHDVSFAVKKKQIVALFGHNGAGKSSIVRLLVGLIPVWQGKLVFNGDDLTRANSSERIRSGIAVSYQDESVFSTMTVSQNLRLGGYVLGRNPQRLAEQEDHICNIFPKLRERSDQLAYTLSGGERRMLSIGMALMSDPKLLLLDEPSTGLSPRLTEHVMEIISMIRDKLGMTILLIEQNVRQALTVCDNVVVLKSGKVVHEGAPSGLSRDSTELIKLF